MIESTAMTIVLTATMFLNYSPGQIFPLLCPVREYEWLEDWSCEMVHSDSGYNELGCVFQTQFPGEQHTDTSVTSRFDVNERVEFARINEERCMLFSIRLEAQPSGGTRLTWTQRITALTPAGGWMLQNTDPAELQRLVSELEKKLDYFLGSGQMLRKSPHDVHDQ